MQVQQGYKGYIKVLSFNINPDGNNNYKYKLKSMLNADANNITVLAQQMAFNYSRT